MCIGILYLFKSKYLVFLNFAIDLKWDIGSAWNLY